MITNRPPRAEGVPSPVQSSSILPIEWAYVGGERSLPRHLDPSWNSRFRKSVGIQGAEQSIKSNMAWLWVEKRETRDRGLPRAGRAQICTVYRLLPAGWSRP